MVQLIPNAVLPLAATSIEADPFNGSLQLMIVGMLIVFAALLLIFALLMILKAMDPRPAEPPAAAAPPPPPAGQASTASRAANGGEDLDPTILAVLTAAVAVAVRQPSRIRAVRVVTPQTGTTWSATGRASIHTSHRIRKGPK